jgi:3-hydroxy-9,10-secoandrosta-1,3,5(10)-triene-9,17-dione monooxygenase
MTLVDDAHRLAADFAGDDHVGAELRRLPDTSWKHLVDSGFVRALQPKRWGGGEVHIREFYDACIAVGRSAPSASWVMGVIGVHPWQLALFDERAQEEMWGSDPTRMHSSSYQPTGSVTAAPGGYRISGRWSFSSGSDHCVAVNVGAMSGTRDPGIGVEIADMRSFLLYRDQYEIVDVWHTTGMRGTGSKDIVIDDAFVPEYRTQSHLDYLFDVPLPGQVRNDGPLYRLPWACVFNYALSASVFGSAQRFLDLWIAESADRRVRSGPVKDDALMQHRLAVAMYDLDAAIVKLHRDCDTMWEAAVGGVALDRRERTAIRWNATRGCEVVGRSLTDLFHAASGRTIFVDHPLAAAYHDVMGGLGHAFLVPDQLGRSLAALHLGGSPTEPMV